MTQTTEIAELWLHPPHDLTTLAHVVLHASTYTVDANSDEDAAREYLCKIAAVRFAREFLNPERRVP